MQILLIYFLLSIVITFTLLYLYSDKPQVILKYPNHKEKVSDLYTDDKNVCYRYKTREVKCGNIFNKNKK
jgi:hypothetical protein